MSSKGDAKSSKRVAETTDTEVPVKIARGEKSVHPFFTSPQASQSKKFNISWAGSNDSILKAVTREPEQKRSKVAAFDLDTTLIVTASGRVFAKDDNDWKWFHTSVPSKLESLHNEGYAIAILTNQNGLNSPKKVEGFKRKISSILSQLSMSVTLIAALKKDIHRKPSRAMWDLLDESGLPKFDISESLYVGDAAGRADGWKPKAKKDHSCGDRKFADNIGIKFQTPEEFFLKESASKFSWGDFNPKTIKSDAPLFSPTNTPLVPDNEEQEVIVFVGYPASGKSTFAHRYLIPKGYVHVNQDTLKTREKCIAACQRALQEGKSVVIDNTNADTATRANYVKCAKASNVKTRCFWFTASKELAQHNNAYRAYNAPTGGRELLSGMVFHMYNSKFQEPKTSEGFEEIKKINFVLEGSDEDKMKWKQWWT